MNDEGVFRTAPVAPGLLRILGNMVSKKIHNKKLNKKNSMQKI